MLAQIGGKSQKLCTSSDMRDVKNVKWTGCTHAAALDSGKKVQRTSLCSAGEVICFKDHKDKVLGSRLIPLKQILKSKYC